MTTCRDSADLCWTRGDTSRLDIEVLAGGVPKDITGASLFLTVKTSVAQSDANAVLRLEVTDHDDPATGLSHFNFTNTTAGQFVYDVQLVTADNAVGTLASGTWIVVADVTQRTEPLAEPEPEPEP